MRHIQSTYSKTSNFILLCFVFSCVSILSGQTNKQRLEISSRYKSDILSNFKSKLISEHASKTKRIKELAEQNNWNIKQTLVNGKKVALQEIGADGTPLYYETYSDEARWVSKATTLNTNGLMGLDLDGDGMQVGVWDSGIALENHVEYTSRIIKGDDGREVDSHATRVTGSIISTGHKQEARGVANKASVLTHDWTRDKIEATEAAANGLLLSNHSYGIMADRVPDWYFGAYTKVAQDWDNIMYNAPYYLMVTAAGNAQKSSDNEAPIYGTTTDGFDVLLGFTLAKNGITVAGANSEIDKNGNLIKANVSAYSSFGPVDDGRIKPDLAGNGGAVLSTDSYSNTSYATTSGTSMATPSVTGSLLLLQQYHEQLFGSFMKAATLKGLALHTADDVDEKGPDYKMGWGILNAKRAAEVLYNKDYNSSMIEESLTANETYSITVNAEGDRDLIASISWTDVASNFVNRGELNNTTAALVNDLDIRISQNGKTFLPWKLNPAHAGSAAITGDNSVDPFERIEIPNAKGAYTITITHKGKLQNSSQDFSLILSGVMMTTCTAEAAEQITFSQADDSRVGFTWNGSTDGLYEVQYKEENQQEWLTEYVTSTDFVWHGLIQDKTYTMRIRTFCSQNVASKYSKTVSFTFIGKETVLDSLNTLSLKDTVPFSVYPNPAMDEIQLNIETSDTAMYRIVSTSGAELKMGFANTARINVSDLPSGLYILQIQDFDLNRSTKFYKY